MKTIAANKLKHYDRDKGERALTPFVFNVNELVSLMNMHVQNRLYARIDW